MTHPYEDKTIEELTALEMELRKHQPERQAELWEVYSWIGLKHHERERLLRAEGAVNLEGFLEGKFVIAGTGSRSFDKTTDPAFDKLMEQVEVNHQKFGDQLVIMSGGAQGWDAAVAEAAYWRDVPYVLCLPNPGYGQYYWGGADQMWEFDYMVQCAWAVEYTNEVLGTRSLYYEGVHMNFHRNQRMVDLADAFWVFNETSRGTKDCVNRIRTANKPYKVLG